jgi:hypothetical protein
MHTTFRTLIATLALVGLSSTVQATLVHVSQGGTSLGFINSYADASSNTSAQNYNFSSSKNHLITGPTLVNQRGHIFFFEGSDGLSFNAIFGSVGSGPNGNVQWNLSLTGNSGNANVLRSDDSGELTEPTPNNFRGRWTYLQSLGDGGVIGALSGNNWALTIDPVSYTNLPALVAYDASGSNITLAVNTTDDIVFSYAQVPEPASLALVGLGLVGLGFGRRKKA